jgi:hypothetical protein
MELKNSGDFQWNEKALFSYSICGMDYKCKRIFLSSNNSLLSTRSGSGTQQSTGQTAAHCGSS